MAGNLLAWYDRNARALPWRQPPGVLADPYAVWLSEIMLQQTTVKAVIPYYQKFLARWPHVDDLASAGLDDILAAWAGLGYYSRARNLHGCAQMIAKEHGGAFPDTEQALLKLPGIGPYTAAAIAAIAFNRPAAAVDGNIERVVSRLFAIEAPLPGAKTRIKAMAEQIVPQDRPGDFTQAMMDLGAGLCAPRTPSCLLCPLADHCEGRTRGIAAALPVKAPKKERPTRYGAVFLAIREDGSVLLRRRPPKGLLGGMLEVPSTEWSERRMNGDSTDHAPLPARWHSIPATVGHTFTHFHLELNVYLATGLTQPDTPPRCKWYPQSALKDEALPSVMRKVLARGLEAI
ncbi:MAG: A/G-specific adenine glycosylase [Hyphomicrobiales bacterium]|nr:A/G-specific adenine glycosylase [Hyphomicrobiales bacterium]